MKLTRVKLDELKQARSVEQWNAACDKIKNARGGEYPPDWFEKVLLAGLNINLDGN